jgi:hypothetical protein
VTSDDGVIRVRVLGKVRRRCALLCRNVEAGKEIVK